jgi:hypothetical protein
MSVLLWLRFHFKGDGDLAQDFLRQPGGGHCPSEFKRAVQKINTLQYGGGSVIDDVHVLEDGIPEVQTVKDDFRVSRT